MISFAALGSRIIALKGGERRQAGLWIVGGVLGQRGIQFISNLILTRLLFPEAFGLMAICSIAIAALAMFSDFGLKQSIVNSKRADDATFLNTVWSIQILRGLVMWLAISLLAVPLSRFYAQPDLAWMLVGVGFATAITSFSSVRVLSAERDLRQHSLTIHLVVTQVLTTIATVSCAHYLRDTWALVYGTILGAVFGLALSFVFFEKHRHRFLIEASSLKEVFNFGQWLFLATAISFVGTEGIRSLQAQFVGVTLFGVLAIAHTMTMIFNEIPQRFYNSVFFPAIARSSREPDKVSQKNLDLIRGKILLFSLIITALVSLGSQPLIDLLYDARYQEAGRFLPLMLITNAAFGVSQGYLSYHVAAGNGRRFLTLGIVTTVLRLTGFYVGFSIGGTYGMLIGIAVAGFVSYPIIALSKIDVVSWRIDLAAFGGLALISIMVWSQF